MNGESLAVIAVILGMAAMFVRAKRRGMALLCLPLISVPLFHLAHHVAGPIGRGFGRSFGWDFPAMNIGLIIIGVVVGSAACAMFSRIIPTRRGTTGYLILTLLFQVAIGIGYVINLV
ncbi:MAG: hypothetical protein FWH02_01895 [Oscillospiraceae bacterium]|nr:hypothetical protein [Oscillospiraceae bacterium]